MKYVLDHIDHLIYRSICPSVLIKTIDAGGYNLNIWNNELSFDEEIKMNLSQQLNQLKKKKHMRHCINVTHAACIRHIMILSSYITEIKSLEKIKPAHQDVIRNYLLLQNKIYTIIGFIEENYGQYTRFKNSPCLVHPERLSNYRLRFTEIKQILTLRCNDRVLLKIALMELEDFFNATSSTLYKYEKYIYFKEYIFHLEKLVFSNGKTHWDTNLRNCLLFLNYNHFSFVNYIMEQLRSEIISLETNAEKIAQWQLFYKEFKQLNYLPDLALFPDSHSIKKQLLNKIKAEINYLQNMQLRITIAPSTNAVNTKEEKILTALSVPQLALFIRLLIDVGILQTGSRSAILRKIAASLSTAKTGSMSEESLRIKFYTPQTAAINIIKEYLYKMINLLRDY